MSPNQRTSLQWIASRPQHNVLAFLSLRALLRYPSGRTVNGTAELYRLAYDEFIAEVSNELLGGCHAYGRPIFIPNDPVFSLNRKGFSNIMTRLALPDTASLESQMESVCDIWGRNPWSRPDSSIKSMTGSYSLLGALHSEYANGE